jgi:hypothetical protein
VLMSAVLERFAVYENRSVIVAVLVIADVV